jgi:hypothetical protein
VQPDDGFHHHHNSRGRFYRIRHIFGKFKNELRKQKDLPIGHLQSIPLQTIA